MKIASSSVQLTSTHLFERATTRRESLEMWVGSAREAGSDVTKTGAPRGIPPVEPAPEADASAKQADAQKDDAEGMSSRDRLELAILRKTFGLGRALVRSARDARDTYDRSGGRAAQAEGAAGGGASKPEGWGLRYQLVETSVEHEVSAFGAQGRVVTADGRELAFQAALIMERARVDSRRVEIEAGDAAKKVDPLVLNVGGGAASFSGRTSFDVNADGAQETVARLEGGSAYLALDRNGNGKVDSGAELFGPTSGSGFGELAALDQDGNGWVDEGDAAYDSLRLWSQDSGTLRSLRAAGVGAIYARAAVTPFEVKDAAGAAQGTVVESGVFLREDGSAGTVQHVDLAM